MPQIASFNSKWVNTSNEFSYLSQPQVMTAVNGIGLRWHTMNIQHILHVEFRSPPDINTLTKHKFDSVYLCQPLISLNSIDSWFSHEKMEFLPKRSKNIENTRQKIYWNKRNNEFAWKITSRSNQLQSKQINNQIIFSK